MQVFWNNGIIEPSYFIENETGLLRDSKWGTLSWLVKQFFFYQIEHVVSHIFRHRRLPPPYSKTNKGLTIPRTIF